MITSSALAGVRDIRYGFFTRQGGHSAGLFASLNCGFGSGDDQALVAKNRAMVAAELGIPADRLITAYQHHGADVVTVTTPWRPGDAPRADALVTDRRGLALGVLTADCAPVLFADQAGRVVGAAHAGWKGAVGGVLEATVAAMEALGCARTNIIAVIGPAIGPDCYETGPRFHARFIDESSANARFFKPSRRSAHHMFDLPGYIVAKLEQMGLYRIEDLAMCTYARENLFFSYRRATHRDEADYGRQISAIGL